MVKVYSIDGITPVVHPEAFVHPTAVLIGDVVIGNGVYIGPCASLRGDLGRLIVKAGANVQDGCIMHGFPGTDTLIEEDGHIGHGAVLHGCIVKTNAMVGMNAVVQDYAVVGESAIIGAAALIKAGMEIPPRVLVAGVPGRVVRDLTEQELAWKIRGTKAYQNLVLRSLNTMQLTEALTEIEPNRQRLKLPDLKPLVEMKKG